MCINSLDDKKGGKEKSDNEDDKQDSKMVGDSGCRCQDAKKIDKINNGNLRKWLGELGACCPNHHVHIFAGWPPIFIGGY